MAKKWDELTDEEQEEAVGLLHRANHNWRKLYNGPNEKLDLIETAINTLDDQRRKFQKLGMTACRVGAVLLLFNEKEEILVGKRKSSHGAGTYSLPGGAIEFMEDVRTAVSREAGEEIGIAIPRHLIFPCEWVDSVWVDPHKGQQHWVTLFTEANLPFDQEPRLMEPEKCEGWQWVNPFTLLDGPLPLFHPLEMYLLKYPVQNWPRFRNRVHRS